jgi:3',5'-nucleoside bisphosphate phosphatase
MIEGKADLHLHTLCSDGELTPAELIRKAAAAGLKAIAVTDHDTIDGLQEARNAAKRIGIEVVAGVELSVSAGGQEVHMLGYYFDAEHEGLRQHLELFRQQRFDRAVAMVDRLNKAGIRLQFEAVLACSRGKALGRPHVAAALQHAGYVMTRQEAFARFLGPTGTAYVAKPEFPAQDALALLHDAGGIGVLAHPSHWTPDAVVKSLIRIGLDGIETVHPSHEPWLTAFYTQLAQRYSLVETGGSDYHGSRPQDEDNLGRYTIPLSRVEMLRRRAA